MQFDGTPNVGAESLSELLETPTNEGHWMMTIIDDEGAVAEDQEIGTSPELRVEDRPSCPECGADPVHQATISRVPDGALELVILACMQCAKDHPAWF